MEIERFDFMGIPLVGVRFAYKGKPFEKEASAYPRLTKSARTTGWNVFRVENKLQNGIPDIVMFKGPDYLLLEVKVCRKIRLTSPLHDVHWQVGQTEFAYKCWKSDVKYALLVIQQHDFIYCVKDTEYVEQRLSSESEIVPDFIGRLRLLS